MSVSHTFLVHLKNCLFCCFLRTHCLEMCAEKNIGLFAQTAFTHIFASRKQFKLKYRHIKSPLFEKKKKNTLSDAVNPFSRFSVAMATACCRLTDRYSYEYKKKKDFRGDRQRRVETSTGLNECVKT